MKHAIKNVSELRPGELFSGAVVIRDKEGNPHNLLLVRQQGTHNYYYAINSGERVGPFRSDKQAKEAGKQAVTSQENPGLLEALGRLGSAIGGANAAIDLQDKLVKKRVMKPIIGRRSKVKKSKKNPRLYPQSTANHNVPSNVFVIGETSAMSGEISTTYYIDYEGNIWKVGDWVGDKPTPAFMFEIARLTGDTENMLTSRYEAWKRNKENPSYKHKYLPAIKGKRNGSVSHIDLPDDIITRLGSETVDAIFASEDPAGTVRALMTDAADENDYWALEDYTRLLAILLADGNLKWEDTERMREENPTIAEKLDSLNPVFCQICKNRLYRKDNPRLICPRCGHNNTGPEAYIISKYRPNPSYTVHVEAPAIRESLDVKAFTIGGALRKGKSRLRAAAKVHPKWSVEKKNPDYVPPYEPNDMNAAVIYSRGTRELFEQGFIDEAWQRYLNDPNGGASEDFSGVTKDEFVRAMNRTNQVESNPSRKYNRKRLPMAVLINPDSVRGIYGNLSRIEDNSEGLPQYQYNSHYEHRSAIFSGFRHKGLDGIDYKITHGALSPVEFEDASLMLAESGETRENPSEREQGFSGTKARISRLALARAHAETRLRQGDRTAAVELARINEQIAREQQRRTKENNPWGEGKTYNRLNRLKAQQGKIGDWLDTNKHASDKARRKAETKFQQLERHIQKETGRLYGIERNGTFEIPPAIKSRLNKHSRMFHGENNKHFGKVRNVEISDHVKARHFTRNGRLPYVKLLKDANGKHAHPKHACEDCCIEFNPSNSFVGMTANKRIQLMGAGVKSAGKWTRRNLLRAHRNGELEEQEGLVIHGDAENTVIDLGPVDVLWYETEEKHADTDNPPLINYYHNHGEETNRVEDKPHLMLDENGMFYLKGGNYDVTEAGIEN